MIDKKKNSRSEKYLIYSVITITTIELRFVICTR